MEGWGDLWSPAGVLGVTGTLGVLALRWPAGRRGHAPGCLLSLLLAMLSWSPSAADDSLRMVFTAVVIWGLLWAFAALSERPESKSVKKLPLIWIGMSGLCLLTSAGDVVTLFFGLHVVTCATAMCHDAPCREFATRNVTPHFVTAALLLLGFVLLALLTGSTRVATIAESLQASYVNHDAARYAIAGGGSRVLTLSIVLIGSALCGYFVGAPFHSHVVDDVAKSHSLSATAVLLLPRAAALLVWLKLWPAVLTGSEATAHLLAIVLAAVTLIVPLVQARGERKLVRQWTLLAVAQGGWLLLAIAANSFERKVAAHSAAWPVIEWNLPTAVQAAWLLLLVDGVALIGLFGVLSALQRRDRAVEFVEDFQGLGRFEPVAAGCTAVCLLSLSGGPLLVGFWSRLFVAMSVMDVRGEWGPPQMLVPHFGLLLLTALAVISSVWSASIGGRTLWTMFFGIPLGQPRPAGPVSSLFAAIIASVLLVVCGLLPGPLLGWLCAPW